MVSPSQVLRSVCHTRAYGRFLRSAHGQFVILHLSPNKGRCVVDCLLEVLGIPAEVKAYREKFSAMKSVVEKHLAGLSEGQRQELDKVVLGQASAGERMIYRSSELTRVELLHKHLAGVGEIKISPGNKSPK